jgi:hypothetical protein
MHKCSHWCSGMAVVLMVACGAVAEVQDLAAELGALDALRNGIHTDLDEVTRQGARLLAEHREPEAQARIYYQLAHIESQSGLQRPEVVIGYIRSALERPLDAYLTPQLYMYWGNAIEVAHRGAKGDALRGARRLAVEQYLRGLSEALRLQGDAGDNDRADITGELGPIVRRQRPGPDNKAIGAAAYAQWQVAKRIEHLRGFEQAFEAQIVYLYSRIPFDNDELAMMARDALRGHPEVAERLVDAATRAVEARTREEVIRHLQDAVDKVEQVPVILSADVERPDHGDDATGHEIRRNQAASFDGETKRTRGWGVWGWAMVIVVVIAGGAVVAVVRWHSNRSVVGGEGVRQKV